VLNKPDTTD
jgi:hypothetical protein